MNYEVELAQPNFKSYKVITIFMAILNAVSFIFYFLNAENSFLKIICVAAILASAILLFVLFKKMAVWQNAFKAVAFLMAIIALSWLLAGNYYFLLLFSLLAVFSFISLQPPVINFTTEGVKYPSFPIKFYSWEQVNQVLIKDDVLSIDLVENKFLQFLLPATTVSKIEIPVFNKWCQNNIESSSVGEK